MREHEQIQETKADAVVKKKLVQYPLQSRYCITGESIKYFMAPITEEQAMLIVENKDPYLDILVNGINVHVKSIYTLLKDAKDTKNITNNTMFDIKRLFDEKNMNNMPASYNFETREGSLNMTICRDFLTHYKYGLSVIGNPEHVIIYKSTV